MGQNLISAELKSGIISALDDVATTFSREIFYTQKAETIYISQNNDFIYGYPETAEVSGYNYVTGSFSGRIAYVNRYTPYPDHFTSFDMKNEIFRGTVRLRVDASGKALLKNNENIEIDGEKFEKISDPRPHGFFGPEWYDIFLKKSS